MTGRTRLRGATLVLAAALAGMVLAGACSDTDGGSRATPAPTEAAATQTPGPTQTVPPGRDLLVLALEAGTEQKDTRSYPVVEIVTVDPASGRRVASFRVGSTDEFVLPGWVFAAGREVVTMSDRRVVRWSLDGRELATLLRFDPAQWPTRAVRSHDGRMLAVGWESADLRDFDRGELIVLEMATGRVLHRWGMDILREALGAWPAPIAWHADDGGLEVMGFAHRDGPGVFASVRLDGAVTRRGATVAAVDPGGRVLATVPGGWTFACEGLGLGGEEVVFVEPVGGRELGRGRLDGYALVSFVFEPGGNGVLMRAAPFQRLAGATERCWTWEGNETWLFFPATGKLEPVADPEAVVTGWRERLLPAVPTVSCPGQTVPAVGLQLPWQMWCPDGGEISVAGRPIATATSGAVAGVVRFEQ
jgi:hypothetical protein